VRSAVFSRSGAIVLTAGSDGTARLWEVSTGTPFILRPHLGPLNVAAFGPGDTVMGMAGRDGAALWRISARGVTPLRTLPGQADGLAFSEHGDHVLTTGRRAVRVWNAGNGHLQTRLPSAAPITRARFSPSGRVVAIADIGGLVSLWNLRVRSVARVLAA